MDKIFLALPFDSKASPPSRDFKVPTSIGEIPVSPCYFDTASQSTENKISSAREELVRLFLETNYTRLLFLDSDSIVDADDLLPLVTSPHLVAYALYAYRHLWERRSKLKAYPQETCLLRQGGLGCAMIRREVFSTLNSPYFSFRGKPQIWKREDYTFFLKLWKHKIDPYVYPKIEVGHQCRESDDIYYFNNDLSSVIRTGGKQYANIQTG